MVCRRFYLAAYLDIQSLFFLPSISIFPMPCGQGFSQIFLTRNVPHWCNEGINKLHYLWLEREEAFNQGQNCLLFKQSWLCVPCNFGPSGHFESMGASSSQKLDPAEHFLLMSLPLNPPREERTDVSGPPEPTGTFRWRDPKVYQILLTVSSEWI